MRLEKIANFLSRIPKQYWVIIPAVFILVILLAKNPYSERNLIANLEPFPDTFHYIATPRCFLEGQGWRLCRGDELPGVSPSVPPLYSVTLLPAYVINMDARNFYFVNVLLSLTSLALLFFIMKRLGVSLMVQAPLAFLFVTNYFVYWLPTIAMAENLLITLFLACIALFFLPVSKLSAVFAGFLITSLYGAKFAALPLVFVFGTGYLTQILISKSRKQLLLISGIFLVTCLSFFVLFGGWQTISSIFFPEWNAIKNNSSIDSLNSWYSLSYIENNWHFYYRVLIGNQERFLWSTEPLAPQLFLIFGWIGLLYGITQKKTRILASSILFAILLLVITNSMFYATDARYVIIALPSAFVGISLLFHSTSNKITLKHTSKMPTIAAIVLLLLTTAYAIHSLGRLKLQVALNLKYSAQPWWYLSVQEANRFFDEDIDNKPYLITLASAYYLDFFSNGNYKPLPLSNQQDFKGSMPEVWGIPQNDDLFPTYYHLLNQGNEIYVMNYGTSAQEGFQNAFMELSQKFSVTEVSVGCHNLCNIYKISLSENDISEN